jgi:hypothetical protein
MTDGTKIMADQDYLKSEDYKKKYEELMKRCEEFNIWFESHKRKMNINLPPGPAKTMDLQWPRDKKAWPWPPTLFQVCSVCGIGSELNKAMSFVCNNPQCPTRVTCSTSGTSI